MNPADAASHRAFRDALALPFDLLVDEGSQVATTYGAIKPDGSEIARTVVIVGKDGRVVFVESGAPSIETLIAAVETADDEPSGPSASESPHSR